MSTLLIYKKTNIFKTPCDAIVNTVNCVGVMGGGLAKAFRDRFPNMYEEYRDICRRKLLKPGQMHYYAPSIEYSKHIINFPTKNHWKYDSKMEYITTGLVALKDCLITNKINSVAIPALGCSLGGLNWEDVKKEIEAIDWGNIYVEVYEPWSERV